MRTMLVACSVVLAPLLSGCLVFTCDCGDDGTTSSSSSYSSSSSSSSSSGDTPPRLEVQVNGPLRAGSTVTVSAWDTRGLSSVSFHFNGILSLPMSGTQDSVTVYAEQLGEGYGVMMVRVWDLDGNATSRDVTGFLVDLTPPLVRLVSDAVVRADGYGEHGDLTLWMGDAFYLDSAILSFGGVSLGHDLTPAQRAGIGQQWDTSLVIFSGANLPAGSGTANVTVRDAAGNSSVLSFPLLVDGTAPGVKLKRPAPQDVFVSVIPVLAEASDGETEAVTLTVLIGGTPALVAAGPVVDVELRASDFAVGPSTVQVVATDEAGNQSESAEVDIVIAPAS